MAPFLHFGKGRAWRDSLTGRLQQLTDPWVVQQVSRNRDQNEQQEDFLANSSQFDDWPLVAHPAGSGLSLDAALYRTDWRGDLR
jgi:hypothetical protein